MSSFYVKICGLTNTPDWQNAAENDADLTGLIFYPPSPRGVTVEGACKMREELSWSTPTSDDGSSLDAFLDSDTAPLPRRVGVFVNPSEADIESAAEAAHLDAIQIHGDQPEAAYSTAAKLGIPVIRALSIKDSVEAKLFESEYQKAEDSGGATIIAFLCDTYVKGKHGGTGERFNHKLLLPYLQEYPILLAGGLTASNIADIVADLPGLRGVDVASGVECEHGLKDHASVARFIAEARAGAKRWS
jgi:phosphoribosylanthranilate isomerase